MNTLFMGIHWPSDPASCLCTTLSPSIREGCQVSAFLRLGRESDVIIFDGVLLAPRSRMSKCLLSKAGTGPLSLPHEGKKIGRMRNEAS